MDDAIKRHEDVIEQLRGAGLTNKVNDYIKAKIGAHRHSDIFMVKSELNRLSKPSNRPFRIDQYFNGQISDYTELLASGLTHHVDLVTERKLRDEIARFQGVYTVGASEAMDLFVKDNKERILHEYHNQKSEVTVLDISETIYRKEERMHFSVRCEIFVLDKRHYRKNASIDRLLTSATKFKGLTQNISLNGLRLRAQQPCEKGALLLVKFSGIEQEFRMDSPYVLFECVFSERASRNQKYKEFPHSLSMRKVNRPSNQEFDLYSARLINANKLRLSVDIDNVVRAVDNNITEQFITNRDPGLTLFGGKESLVALGNSIGKETFDLFSLEQGSVLPSLLRKDKANKLELCKPSFWFVIKQKDGRFFSTFIREGKLFALFSAYCLLRSDAHFFQITKTRAIKDRAFASHSLPNTSNLSAKATRNRRMTDYYSPSARSFVSDLQHVYHIVPVDKNVLTSISPMTEKKDFTPNVINKFASFHLDNKKVEPLEFVMVRGKDSRMEDRYNLKTTVELDANGSTIKAATIDISESGLAITLSDNEASLIRDKMVSVRFPEIAPIGTVSATANYRVIRQHNGKVFLHSDIRDKKPAYKFWSKYFDRNFKNLRPSGDLRFLGKDFLGLERALRNVKNSSDVYIKGLIQPSHKGVSVSTVNFPKAAFTHFPLGREFIRLNMPSVTFKKIFGSYNPQTGISQMLRRVNKKNPYEHHVLLVGIKEGRSAFTVDHSMLYMPGEINLSKIGVIEKQMFKRGLKPLWFSMTVTRKSPVFDKYFREELDYIEINSSHRAELLNNRIKQTTGVFSISPLNEYIEHIKVLSE